VDTVFVFGVAGVVTNATALEDNSPPNHSGSGSGAILFTNVWQLDLAPAFVEPTDRALSVSFSNETGSSFLEWQGGNGSFSIVLMREGGPVDAAPVDGTVYAADSTFGSGDEIGVSNYVVAVTNGNSCWVNGLVESQEYHVAIFEGNGLGTCSDYLNDPRRNNMIYTLVVLGEFALTVNGGRVEVCWETVSEVLTVGFWVYRRGEGGSWVRVNDQLVPAQGLANGGLGSRYCIEDPGARPGGTYTYLLLEVDLHGGENAYGPFDRTAYTLRLQSPMSADSDRVRITWMSRSNEVYRVLRSPAVTGPFAPAATGLLATPPANVYSDSPARAAFYIISSEPSR
jgi:hypothetical protein